MLNKTILLTVFVAFAFTVAAQDVDKIIEDRNEVYFSFVEKEAAVLDELSRIISIDNVNDDFQVFAYANKSGFSGFLEKGIQYEILQHPGTLIRPRMLDKVDVKAIQSWDFYPTYDAYVDMMYQFEANFPDICEVFSIGYTNEERELLVARISDNVGQAEGEPEFLYSSSMHGDETTGYVLMLRLIDYLLNGYGNDPRLTNIVDGIDIYISPLANPDGSYHVGNSNIYGAQRFNAMGVDLNRNYPDPEDGPHPDGNPWQKETVHYMHFAAEHNFVMGANIHGGTEVLNYPWDTWPRLAADDDWWVYVCREYADTAHIHAPSNYLSGYNNGITNGYQWYSISGGRQDYMNYFHQAREVTLEISDVKLLPASQLPAHWDYNYRSFLNYLEQATFGVRGRITDSATGDPLEAEVFVLNHEEDSSWAYSSLPIGNYHRLLHAGTYDIRYSKSGYLTQTHENVVVQNRQATLIDVELVKAFSIVEEGMDATFNIFPNPASTDLIHLNSEHALGMISIFDLSGKLVQQTDAGMEKEKSINIQDLENGTYIIMLQMHGKTVHRKFVKL